MTDQVEDARVARAEAAYKAGRAEVLLGSHAVALSFFDEAVALNGELGRHTLQAFCDFEAAFCLEALGEPGEAARRFECAARAARCDGTVSVPGRGVRRS